MFGKNVSFVGMKISKLINYGQGTMVYKAKNKKSLCKGSVFHVIFFGKFEGGGGTHFHGAEAPNACLEQFWPDFNQNKQFQIPTHQTHFLKIIFN
jgi:hypothetical protein